VGFVEASNQTPRSRSPEKTEPAKGCRLGVTNALSVHRFRAEIRVRGDVAVRDRAQATPGVLEDRRFCSKAALAIRDSAAPGPTSAATSSAGALFARTETPALLSR